MGSKLNNEILDALSENGELTLKELYKILFDNPDLDLQESTKKHRVRSALYNLQQHEKIERCGDATYRVSDK